MARFTVKYLSEKTRGGRTNYYWSPSPELRADGWKSRSLGNDRAAAIEMAKNLNAEVEAWRADTPATQAKRPAAGSVSEMIRRYRASRFFMDKKPRTQRGYLQNLKIIEAWAGDEPAASITPMDVQTLYDSMRVKTLPKANAVIRVLRLLFEFGRRAGMVQFNPAVRPGMISPPPRQVMWNEEQLEIIIDTADKMGRASIGTACMIGAFLGQREVDILPMSRTVYRDGVFKFKQSKTGQWVEVRAVPELFDRLAAGDLHPPAAATTIIVSETTGRPYNESDFQHKFAEIRQVAIDGSNKFGVRPHPDLGLEELRFMDLRRTAVVWLAEEGATDEQIASVTGHKYETIKQILEVYLPRRGAVANIAIDLLEARRARIKKDNKSR